MVQRKDPANRAHGRSWRRMRTCPHSTCGGVQHKGHARCLTSQLCETARGCGLVSAIQVILYKITNVNHTVEPYVPFELAPKPWLAGSWIDGAVPSAAGARPLLTL